MKPFVTSYDSDNKGSDNLGGYEYCGYLIVLKNKDGKIIYDQTSAGSLRQAFKEKANMIEDVLRYEVGQELTGKLTPLKPRDDLGRIPR